MQGRITSYNVLIIYAQSLTIIFGGILRHRCTWSTHTAPSIISTFLYRHNVRSISRTSAFTFPYSTFRRYFGINTIWYWHFHRVCDKLFSSIRGCLLWFFVVLAFDTTTIIPLEAFAIFYTTVYSILPSIAGGLSLSIRYPRDCGHTP